MTETVPSHVLPWLRHCFAESAVYGFLILIFWIIAVSALEQYLEHESDFPGIFAVLGLTFIASTARKLRNLRESKEAKLHNADLNVSAQRATLPATRLSVFTWSATVSGTVFLVLLAALFLFLTVAT